MIKYAFVGGIFTPTIKNMIESSSRGVIQYAADTLEKCYIEGLAHYVDDLIIFNLPFIGSYPRLSNIRVFKSQNEKLKYSSSICTCYNIGFNNFIAYKSISRYRSLENALYKWVMDNQDEQLCIIVYSAHTPFMKACSDLKCRFPNIKLILIVPDLPEFMAHSSSLVMNALRRVNVGLANELYKNFDGFVFLSEQMKERIQVSEERFEVIEGIYAKQFSQSVEHENSQDIIYTGTLAARYGIMNLVKAFTLIKNSDARLIIIGAGDSEDNIKDFSKNDSRIKYLGQMPREEVLKIQAKGALLVNPRTSEGEFTKYSFPSKTMEYLASGVPTLINRLPGIPEEYYQYSFQPENESIEALSKIITEILNMPISERIEFGKKAQEFIYKKKNPISQCSKLVRLAERICEFHM